MGKRLTVQHEIDQAAVRRFNGLLPRDWVYREQTRDYGVDEEVEVFANGNSTGILFKVQIKGSKGVRVRHNDLISYQMDVDDVEYLAEQLTVPSFLILVDVSDDRVWWHCMQTDSSLRARSAQARTKGRRTVVVHIDAASRLPQSLGQLYRRLHEAQCLLGLRVISQPQAGHFAGAVTDIEDIEAILLSFQSKMSIVQLEQVRRHYAQDDYETGDAVLQKILDNPETELAARFQAWLFVEKSMVHRKDEGTTDLSWGEVILFVATRLRQCSTDGPLHLRAYAAFAYHIALLQTRVERDDSLAMNAVLHEQDARDDLGEVLWASVLPTARYGSRQRIVLSMQHCVRLIHFMLEHSMPGLVPQCIARLLSVTWVFTRALRNDGLSDATAVLRDRMLSFAELGAEIALVMRDWLSAELIAGQIIAFADPADAADLGALRKRAQAQAERLPEGAPRDNALREVDRATELVAQMAAEPPPISIEDEKRMYAQMAQAVGIDLSDPQDEVARIVQIGLDDLDPGRALKTCRYLFIKLCGGRGLPAAILKLPTAGAKQLICTKTGASIAALRLDDALAGMQTQYCTGCDSKDPQPDSWQWSHEWQHQQNDLHADRYREE